jgi:hypothetical protein
MYAPSTIDANTRHWLIAFTQGDRVFEFLQFRATCHAEVPGSICVGTRFVVLGQMLRSTSA